MPPWAATVWLRVGKTLVMQAVFSPASAAAHRRAQPRTAGADDDDVIGVIDDLVGVRHGERPKAIFNTANKAKAPPITARKLSSRIERYFQPSSWT